MRVRLVCSAAALFDQATPFNLEKLAARSCALATFVTREGSFAATHFVSQETANGANRRNTLLVVAFVSRGISETRKNLMNACT